MMCKTKKVKNNIVHFQKIHVKKSRTTKHENKKYKSSFLQDDVRQ